MTSATVRTQVRRSTYRGKVGWTLSGKDARGRRLSVFFEHETAARRWADKLKSDPAGALWLPMTLKDFEP